MNKDQALRLALEALEYPGPSWIEARQPAITAIKQALAHPEPEPVAWTDIDFTNIYISEMVANENNADVPLYTSPPKREPLTDEQIKDALVSVDAETKRLPSGFRDFARAIEAAHGIKGER